MKETSHHSIKQEIRYRLNKTNHYDILDLQKQCTADDIKKSYKKMALRFHPDKNTEQGSKQVFNKITNSYNVLSNKDKKAEYDQKNKPKPSYTNFETGKNFNYFTSKNKYGFYPFGNQQRFRKYQNGFKQQNQQYEAQQKKKEQKQKQYEQMQKQFAKLFNNLFRNMGKQKSPENDFKKQNEYQRNQQKEKMQKMKRQYQQQQKAEKSKQRIKRQQIKTKKLLLFFAFMFLAIFIGPDLIRSFTVKPVYSFTKNNNYRYERKTQYLKSIFYVNQKFFSAETSKLEIQRIEETVDRKYVQNLKRQCSMSMNQKRKLQRKGLDQKIGPSRQYYLQKSRKISIAACNLLVDLTDQNLSYFIKINK